MRTPEDRERYLRGAVDEGGSDVTLREVRWALELLDAERAQTTRLRTALAKREFDEEDGGLMCSACRSLWPLDGHRDTAWDHCHEHHPDCPDFSAEGVVR